MSPCPKCGAASGHRGVVIPWSGGTAPEVLHHCPRDGLWSEPAKDAAYLMAKVRPWLLRREAIGEDRCGAQMDCGHYCGRVNQHGPVEGLPDGHGCIVCEDPAGGKYPSAVEAGGDAK